jgi:CHAT domain
MANKTKTHKDAPSSSGTARSAPQGVYEFVMPAGEDDAQAPARQRGGAPARGAGASAPVLPEGLSRGQVAHALRFRSLAPSRDRAGGGAAARARAVAGRDVVVLHLEQGLDLWLHPAHAAALLQGGSLPGPASPSATPSRGGAAAPASVQVPPTLRWPGAPRQRDGLLAKVKQVALEGLDVITGAVVDIAVDAAAETVAETAGQWLDSRIQPGVYALSADALRPLGQGQGQSQGQASGDAKAHKPLSLLPQADATDAPLLVFVHGTFSSTARAFDDLWSQHRLAVIERLFKHYGGRVYGFEHPTLTVSPVANALALAQTLPEGAVLHLLTHSRGGLVAEVLATVAADPAAALNRLGLLHPRDHDALKALATCVVQKNIRVDKIVRVACPAKGTTLASGRLDAYLSVFSWCLRLAGLPAVPGLVDFTAAVAQHALDESNLPGLEAMTPGSPLVTWLSQGVATDRLRVIAGDIEGSAADEAFSFKAWVKRLLSDAYYWEDNDLVVQTQSMYGGAQRQQPALFFLHQGPDVSHLRYFSNKKTAEMLARALVEDRPAGFLTMSDEQRRGEDDMARRKSGLRSGVRGERGAPSEQALRAAGSDAPQRRPVPTLNLHVRNGNLMFTNLPLMVGHYRSFEFAGTERVVNELLGRSMEQALRLGVYPERPGSYQFFRNNQPTAHRRQLPKPPAAIVIGLGDESQLKGKDLSFSVRQAILAWAQRHCEEHRAEGRPGAPCPNFQLAAALIGSGGTGSTPGQSAQLIAQGAHEANLQLALLDDWPMLSELTFMELYLDRATEALRALKDTTQARALQWNVAPVVAQAAGALRRPADIGYRGDAYDLLSVSVPHREGQAPDDDTATLEYTLDTRRARTEMRAQSTQAALVRKMVEKASNIDNDDPQLPKTLYQLLIPRELDGYFSGATSIRMELDPGAADLPWELLDQGEAVAAAAAAAAGDGAAAALREEHRPWAIRTRLIRKLRLDNFREQVRDAGSQSGILVIGEPQTPPPQDNPPFYGYDPLPDASREAEFVYEALKDAAPVVDLLRADDRQPEGPDAKAVINKLLERDWKVVHITGHGEPPLERDNKPVLPRGVVLSDGHLGPDEIRSMRVVPQLVFVNCCHLARGGSKRLSHYNRAQFARTVAQELMGAGVRCVVAAGWAVNDRSALVFARSFYQALTEGETFIAAVHRARIATYEDNPGNNTWAAYQCYGDPDWTLTSVAVQRGEPSAEDAQKARERKHAHIVSPLGLTLACEALSLEATYTLDGGSQAAKDRRLREKNLLEDLRYLQAGIAERHGWDRMGAVAEALAVAYVALGAVDDAVRCYEAAVNAADGSATQKAREQLANLYSRSVEEAFNAQAERIDSARHNKSALKLKTPELSPMQVERLAVAKKIIERLLDDRTTPERYSLDAAHHKRLALIAQSRGDDAATLQRELQAMHARYQQARNLAQDSGANNLFYPLLNCLVAEVALTASQPAAHPLDPKVLESLQADLAVKNEGDTGTPDFWSVVTAIELAMYEAVAQRALAHKTELKDLFADLNSRAHDARQWRSVYDTARLVLRAYQQAPSRDAAEKQAALVLLKQLQGFTLA